jgi:hypothetical protein
VTEKRNLQRGKRPSHRTDREPELAELRSRVAGQAHEIEELRREVGWLSEELIARDEADAEAASSDQEGLHRGLSGHMRRLVHECVPRGSSLVVVSSGDEALLRYVGCRAEHLSQDRHGRHSNHPTCARAAIVQLEAARWRGADVLVIPQTGLWWLEHYPEFTKHLVRTYTQVLHEEDVASIWDLRSPSQLRQIDDMLAGLSVKPGHQPVVLDWHTGQDLATAFPDYKVFSPIEDLPHLPYFDSTVEVVAIPAAAKRKRSTEARRVASDLVAAVASGFPSAMDVLWRSPRLAVGQRGVSVVAVSRDHRALSLHYVRHLVASLPDSFSGELIVGMDRHAVVPRLGPEAARLKRLKVIPVREDDGFVARVRQGAEIAKGEIVVVLDGSTWPVTGWLPPLVRLLREAPDVGAASGIFVEPDGQPLDRQALPAHDDTSTSPSSDDLDAPHRRFLRPTECVPESLFATYRELLLESDSAVADLHAALDSQVRARGLSTLYQPETLAISPWRTQTIRSELESADA